MKNSKIKFMALVAVTTIAIVSRGEMKPLDGSACTDYIADGNIVFAFQRRADADRSLRHTGTECNHGETNDDRGNFKALCQRRTTLNKDVRAYDQKHEAEKKPEIFHFLPPEFFIFLRC